MTPSLDVSEECLGILLDLMTRFLPGVKVWAYGSRVTGKARRNSDLDIVVFAELPRQARAVSDLRDALAESSLPFAVDLHVWSELPAEFHDHIQAAYLVVA